MEERERERDTPRSKEREGGGKYLNNDNSN